MPTRVFLPPNPRPPFFHGTGPTFPDQDLMSMDDEQVKAILLKMDIHALFVPPPADNKEYFRLVTDDRHPTHRFLIACWTGCEKAADNGYMLMGYRRSRHSFEDVERAAKELAEKCSHPETIRRVDNIGPQ